jgi:hypothetical protein
MRPVARPLLGEDEIAATEVLRSGQVLKGRQVAEFEDEFAGLVAERTAFGRIKIFISNGPWRLGLSSCGCHLRK